MLVLIALFLLAAHADPAMQYGYYPNAGDDQSQV
jgi:hypothetical protein